MTKSTKRTAAARTAVIYARLSEATGEAGEVSGSVARQLADCEAWCSRNGYTVAAAFTDDGASGYKATAKRPGQAAALRAVTTGQAAALVVYHLDRLSRQGMGRVGAILDDLEAAGARLVSVSQGLDSSDSSARLVLAVMSEQARAESAAIARRVKRAQVSAIAEGRWTFGQAPYGLRVVEGRLCPDPETEAVAREALRRLAAGATANAVCRWLNSEGHYSRRATKAKAKGEAPTLWQAGRVASWARSVALCGLMPEGSGSAVARRDEHGEPIRCGEGLVTLAEHRAIVEALARRTVTRADGTKSGAGARRGGDRGLLLLGGLGRCALCGSILQAAGAGYGCRAARKGSGCPGTSWRTRAGQTYASGRPRGAALGADDALEALLFSTLAAMAPEDLETVAEAWRGTLAPVEAHEHEAARANLEEALAALADLEDARYLRGEFTGPEGLARYGRLRQALAARVEQARAAMPEAVEEDTLPGLLGALLGADGETVREAWAAATVEDRRAVLAAVFVRVEMAGRAADGTAELRPVIRQAERHESPALRAVS